MGGRVAAQRTFSPAAGDGAQISEAQPGRVKELSIREGDHVNKERIIACMDKLAQPAQASSAAAASATAGASPPSLSTQQAVMQAISHNPEMFAVARDIAAAQSGAQAARALVNPGIEFDPNLTAYGSEQELLIRQPLEINGARSARTGVAYAQLRMTRADAVIALRNLALATQSAYYRLVEARAQLALTQQLLQISQQFDQIARLQAKQGARPGIDALQADIADERAQQRVMLAKNRSQREQAALNTLMGYAPDTPIGSLSPNKPLSKLQVSAQGALLQALASRAEITAAQEDESMLQQQLRLARAQSRPDLIPQFRAQKVIGGLQEYGIGVAISLPIVDYGSLRNHIRQIEEAAQAQAERIAVVRAQVREDVTRALSSLNTAREVVRSYQHGILAQSGALLHADQVGFQAGRADIVQTLAAQRTYRLVQSDYMHALATEALAQAELDHAVGAFPADMFSAHPHELKGSKRKR